MYLSIDMNRDVNGMFNEMLEMLTQKNCLTLILDRPSKHKKFDFVLNNLIKDVSLVLIFLGVLSKPKLCSECNFC